MNNLGSMTLAKCVNWSEPFAPCAGRRAPGRGRRRQTNSSRSQCSEPVVKLLAEHRTEVAALTSTNTGIELMPPHRFERVIPRSDSEPGLELPCVARRGRVQELAGALLHFCIECGAYGAFGYGVRLRAGRPGRWYCAEHRPRQR